MKSSTLSSRSRRWTLLVTLACVLLLASPLLTVRLHPNDYVGGRSRDAAALQARNSSAVGVMLGELRTSASDLLFLKTERYFHGGIAYALKPGSQTKAPVSSLEGVACAAEGAETVILSPDRDFRGLIGKLHREVHPWRAASDSHEHSEAKREMLPFYRLMTLCDPHSIRAYTIGAFQLKSEDADQALKFIEEGIKHNPQSFQLHLMHGRVWAQKGRDSANAPGAEPGAGLACQLQAIAAYQTAAELALEQRPPEGYLESEENGWTLDEEEDAFAAARSHVLTEKTFGDPEEMQRLARYYLDRLGPDTTLEKYAGDKNSAK